MNGFNKSFANFLQEQIGDSIAKLRNDNRKYKLMLDERTLLMQTIEEQNKTVNQIVELNQRINDIEINYIFLEGMKIFKQIEKSISSFDFYKEFIDSE